MEKRPNQRDRERLVEELSQRVLRLIDQNRRLTDKVEIALERRTGMLCESCRDLLITKLQMGEGCDDD